MSLHTYSCCWLHIVFATLERKIILGKELRFKLAGYFLNYSKENHIYLRTQYVNAEHVHLLVDMPTELSIEKLIQLYKGSSSNWINKNGFLNTRFSWNRGYGVLSVSPSGVDKVHNYIDGQEEHHRVITFQEEYEKMIKVFKMKNRDPLPG